MRYTSLLFIILCLAYIVLFIQNIVLTVLAPDVMTSLNLSAEQMGMLGGAYLYAYAGTQFCSGMLAARFGPRKVLSLMFSISALGGLLFVSSDSYTLSLVGRALTGLGTAVVMTSAFTLFSRWYAPEVYARITAWFFAIGGLGNYIGTAPFSWLNDAFGWRTAYGFVALITLAISIAAWCIVKDWPSTTDTSGMQSRNITFGELRANLSRIARKTDFWRIIGWYCTMSAMFYAFAGLWAGLYLKEVYGFNRVETGTILAMGALGFIVGNPLLAWLCERVFTSYRAGMMLSGPLGLVAACALVFHPDQLSVPVLYGLVLCVGMAANAPNAVASSMARTLFGGRMLGSVGGIFGSAAFLSGACLQVLIGFILEHAKASGLDPAAAYSRAFIPFLACCLISIAACSRLTETYGKTPED